MAQEVETMKKPVIDWRRKILQAGAVAPKTWRRYRASVFQGYLIAAVIAFLILATLAHTVAYFAFDVVITRDVQLINVAAIGDLFQAVSWVGFAPQVTLITLAILLVLWISGLHWETLLSFLSVVGISVLGFVIKILVVRPRPSADLVRVLFQVKDYSFPSGHVLYFTAFFGFMLFLAYTLLKTSWWRTILIVLFGGLVALVGVSRIYEGQHWASDVLAAYLLGSVWLWFSVQVYRWGKPRFFVNQPVAKETPGAPVLDK